MKVCDATLGSPEENLACDEALLDYCEQGEFDEVLPQSNVEGGACGLETRSVPDGPTAGWKPALRRSLPPPTGGTPDEVLRFWAPREYFVVVGYANRVAREVNLEFCRARNIPLLRRCTGGGAVLQGPGCVNYSLLLRISETGPTRNITSTNEFIMRRHATLLTSMLGRDVEACGHTDLALGGLKFSGNAQRRRKEFVLFHGCFLLEMNIDLIAGALHMPSKQPAYRLNRAHAEFLTNIPLAEAELKTALAKEWGASEPIMVSNEQVSKLVREKYSREDWNFKF